MTLNLLLGFQEKEDTSYINYKIKNNASARRITSTPLHKVASKREIVSSTQCGTDIDNPNPSRAHFHFRLVHRAGTR